jgi:hypothetical protein
MTPDPSMMPMEDDGVATPGRSKECDAEALRAAKEAKVNRDFKVVPEDVHGGSAGEEPQGNR